MPAGHNSKTQPALSPRQREIYDLIKDRIRNRGYGPTIWEVVTHFGTRSPGSVSRHLNALEKKGYITREPYRSRAIQLAEPSRSKFRLPVAGELAERNPVRPVEQGAHVDFRPLFDSEQHVCLQVRGDLLVDDQIDDGDYVIVRQQPTCSNGEIVVALLEGQHATVKRFYQEGNRIRLEPSSVSQRPLAPDEVEVLGVVLGVIRKY